MTQLMIQLAVIPPRQKDELHVAYIEFELPWHKTQNRCCYEVFPNIPPVYHCSKHYHN